MTKKSFDYSSDKTYFEPVDQKVDFPSLEKKILDDWDKKRIVKKYLDKNISSTKTFSFLDGPITANNPMGVHHAWGRTYKDIFQRKSTKICKYTKRSIRTPGVLHGLE